MKSVFTIVILIELRYEGIRKTDIMKQSYCVITFFVVVRHGFKKRHIILLKERHIKILFVERDMTILFKERRKTILFRK